MVGHVRMLEIAFDNTVKAKMNLTGHVIIDTNGFFLP